MEDALKVLVGYFAIQNGVSEQEAETLLLNKSEENEGKFTLKENALSILKTKDEERVKTLKGKSVDRTEVFNEAYKKATGEILGNLEKKVTENFGVSKTDKEQKTLDFINFVITEKTKSSESNKITDDKVKTHPLYLTLENSSAEKLKTQKTEFETQIADLKANYLRQENLREVKSRVLAKFDSLKPVLSQNQTVAQNQRKAFATLFEAYDFQKTDNGFIVKQGDKRLEDSHGNPVSLEQLVENTAKDYYDFAVQNDKGGSGNGGGGETGGNAPVKVPTTKEEYEAAIFNAQSSEERTKISDAWKASQS